MLLTDEEILKGALWIARDLSIRYNKEVPDVVREAPAALMRLIEDKTPIRYDPAWAVQPKEES